MSKYTDIEFLDAAKNILLVKDNKTGEIYVKKYISDKQRKIYEHIRERQYECVPKVIDIYPEQDYFVLIEEYIKGCSLQKMLDHGIVFPKEFMRPLVWFLAKTLSPIHSQGLVHRDITPANIVCKDGNELYLVDFGNSRFYKENKSSDTEYLGTRDYAAPEQFGFGQSSRLTDIYAIGKVMLVLMLGSSNYDNPDMRNRLPQRFLRIINRCTNPNPEKRYKSMARLFWAVLRAAYWPFLSTPFLILYTCMYIFVLFHLF